MKITKIDASTVRKHLRNRNAIRSISIGRSYNSAGIGTGTPIKLKPGNQPPELKGQPYLKTTFRKGSFSKTLYTPSSLYAEVGIDWLYGNLPVLLRRFCIEKNIPATTAEQIWKQTGNQHRAIAELRAMQY